MIQVYNLGRGVANCYVRLEAHALGMSYWPSTTISTVYIIFKIHVPVIKVAQTYFPVPYCSVCRGTKLPFINLQDTVNRYTFVAVIPGAMK